MKKPVVVSAFVVDTNVLLSDSNAIHHFDKPNKLLIIPFVVLEELDRHKDRQDEVGRNARDTVRKLSALLATNKELKTGIPLPAGGLLKVVSVNDFDVIHRPQAELVDNKGSGDNRILEVAQAFKATHPDIKVTLVTQDILLRLKGTVLGLDCKDYKRFNAAESVSGLYTGITGLSVAQEDIDVLYEENSLQLSTEQQQLFFPNQFVVLTSNSPNEPGGTKQSGLARCVVEPSGGKYARVVKKDTTKVCNLSAKNKEQAFALDLLLDDKINLVSLVGKAGTGKSILAIAAGLQQVLDQKKYKSLVVLRPIQPLGRDVGFLPGPQPLDAKIATPNGWTTMGEIKANDFVIARDGSPSRVVGVFPKGKKQVYEIETTDGTKTEACENHLWLTQTRENRKRNKPGCLKTTKEIIESLKVGSKINHFLPRNKAVQYCQPRQLPLPAYMLGALLGDGSFGNNIVLSNTDPELIERVRTELTELNCRLVQQSSTINYHFNGNLFNNKPVRKVKTTNKTTNEMLTFNSVGIANKHFPNIKRGSFNDVCLKQATKDNWTFEFVVNESRWQNPIKEAIYKLGLLGCHSDTKFVPDEYRFASIDNRLDLLRGLMDTDGTIKNNGEASFCTTSKQLAIDIQELVRSLGGRATVRTRNRVGKSTTSDHTITSKLVSHEFTISLPPNLNPFYISRKASKHKCSYIHGVGIKTVRPVSDKEVQCIKIENPEHLYLTNDFIVTHNTISEKLEPWIAPIKDSLRFLLSQGGLKTKRGEDTLNHLFDEGIIEVEAMTFIRGRSIANAFIVLDESQNISLHEMKTILTRVGDGTKVVLTGDVEQIDVSNLDSVNNGLAIVVEKFKDQPSAGHVTLTQGVRSPLATLAATIL